MGGFGWGVMKRTVCVQSTPPLNNDKLSYITFDKTLTTIIRTKSVSLRKLVDNLG